MKHNGLLQGLLKSFPAPDFLTMPAVGMELTLRGVRYLELKDKAGGYSIGRYGESFLPKPLEDETFPSSGALKTLLAEVKQKYNFGKQCFQHRGSPAFARRNSRQSGITT